MGFCNLPAHTQRQMDNLLCNLDFAQAYVDDTIAASYTLDEHIHYLRMLFQTFENVGITIKPEKTFLGYPSAVVLGQNVDSMGLSTTSEKLEAIAKLSFPENLRELETYLGMTSYFRNYIPGYADIAKPLQGRKTQMLKRGPVKGRARQTFCDL
jgi:hypothetical protein